MIAGERARRIPRGESPRAVVARRPVEFDFEADQPIWREQVIIPELNAADDAARIGRERGAAPDRYAFTGEGGTEIGAAIKTRPVGEGLRRYDRPTVQIRKLRPER
jgi:hypothetical protein